MVFLLEYDSVQAGAKDLNGRLMELSGENLRVQVGFILNECQTSFKFPGDDYLRDLEKNQIPILHLLAVFLENVEILGRVSV